MTLSLTRVSVCAPSVQNEGNPKDSLPDFLKDHYLTKFGLKKIAMGHLANTLASMTTRALEEDVIVQTALEGAVYEHSVRAVRRRGRR